MNYNVLDCFGEFTNFVLNKQNFFCYFQYYWTIYGCSGLEVDDLDPSAFHVYGPGLTDPDFATPARYFYVQLVKSNGLK